jgi:galactose dehydrogenase
MTTRTIFPDLSGKSVLITGGGSGIGAEITRGFLKQGAKVAFLQRSDATMFCDKTESETGSRPLHIKCDISDVEQLSEAILKAQKAHDGIDTLVNNAADDHRHLTLETSSEDWERLMGVNLKAYFFAAKAVIPGMQAAGAGQIINVTSTSYMMGNSGYPVYVAANSGLNGLTRALAREFGPDRIRVNALAPGWVMTEKQKRNVGDTRGLRRSPE